MNLYFILSIYEALHVSYILLANYLSISKDKNGEKSSGKFFSWRYFCQNRKKGISYQYLSLNDFPNIKIIFAKRASDRWFVIVHFSHTFRTLNCQYFNNTKDPVPKCIYWIWHHFAVKAGMLWILRGFMVNFHFISLCWFNWSAFYPFR